MNKNIKSIFFVLTFIMLLVSVGAVCAADDTDSNDAAISTPQDTSSDVISEQTTSPTDNKIDTKTTIKEDKNLKTATKTVDVNNNNELTTTITNAVEDADNEEYVINLYEVT